MSGVGKQQSCDTCCKPLLTQNQSLWIWSQHLFKYRLHFTPAKQNLFADVFSEAVRSAVEEASLEKTGFFTSLQLLFKLRESCREHRAKVNPFVSVFVFNSKNSGIMAELEIYIGKICDYCCWETEGNGKENI